MFCQKGLSKKFWRVKGFNSGCVASEPGMSDIPIACGPTGSYALDIKQATMIAVPGEDDGGTHQNPNRSLR
jgi:hypothetical protein